MKFKINFINSSQKCFAIIKDKSADEFLLKI